MRIFTPSVFLRTALTIIFAGCLVWLYCSPVPTEFYSRRGVRFKNWWKILPKDQSLYRLTNRTTTPIDRAAIQLRFSNSFSVLSRSCGVDATSQDGKDSYSICAVLNSIRIATRLDVPSPSLGSIVKLDLPASQCLDRIGRWDAYATPNSSNSVLDLGQAQNRSETQPRTAILIRAWDDCGWHPDAVKNIRALVTETALSSPDYRVLILLHVRDETLAQEFIGRDAELLHKLQVPLEFHGMTHIWSYADTKKAYPLVGAYDVFYHTYMPVQLFALSNPIYEYIWNWELDVRYSGHYAQLLSGIEHYSRKYGDDDNQRHFDIPSPDPTPRPSPAASTPDLITFLPVFNASETEWVWRKYLIHYSPNDFRNGLQASVILTNRLSRRLLLKLDEENRRGSAMVAEMFAPTIALENDFKHISVPHPIYFDRQWSSEMLDQVFNHGLHSETGGALAGVIDAEHHFEGSTWYYANRFAPELYARWMGWAKSGPGSRAWEEKNGMICLPPMLLHPIKAESLQMTS